MVEDFEQAWITIEVRLDDLLIRHLQTYLEVDVANYNPNFRVNPLNCLQWMPMYSEVYGMCTERSPFNFCAELYGKVGFIFDRFHSQDCFPRVLRSVSDLDLFCKQLNRCICAHKILSRKLTNIFGYLNMYHIKYHHLPAVAEAGCDSFSRNIVDPLLKVVNSLVLSIILAHAVSILEPRRFWKEMASMRQRLVTLSNTTVGLLDMGKVGFTFTFTFISSEEQLLKYWWDEVRRLPEVVKIHILYYLAPMNFVQMLLSYVA